KRHRLITNGLLLITVICTYIMTASAFYKMNLYESTYGYTRLRLLVYLFLITEIIVLIPMIIGILKPGFKFLEIAFITVFICYSSITFINIDAFVAKQNIQRYQSLSKEMQSDFDIRYLDELSEDALLQIEPLIESSDAATSQFFKETILIQYSKGDASAAWFEYNVSKSSVEKLYKKYYPNGHDATQIPYHEQDSQDY
ncbi:MAG: DUF4173 domain-containing protein, partial [Vallitaleaceae bacterium]|nr:DUF4173 domain-containing protein [Vallitaleaceae bacterium]